MGKKPEESISEADMSVPTKSTLSTPVETYILATSKANFFAYDDKNEILPVQNCFCLAHGND